LPVSRNLSFWHPFVPCSNISLVDDCLWPQA
jgi:hypothetical protein